MSLFRRASKGSVTDEDPERFVNPHDRSLMNVATWLRERDDEHAKNAHALDWFVIDIVGRLPRGNFDPSPEDLRLAADEMISFGRKNKHYRPNVDWDAWFADERSHRGLTSKEFGLEYAETASRVEARTREIRDHEYSNLVDDLVEQGYGPKLKAMDKITSVRRTGEFLSECAARFERFGYRTLDERDRDVETARAIAPVLQVRCPCEAARFTALAEQFDPERQIKAAPLTEAVVSHALTMLLRMDKVSQVSPDAETLLVRLIEAIWKAYRREAITLDQALDLVFDLP